MPFLNLWKFFVSCLKFDATLIQWHECSYKFFLIVCRLGSLWGPEVWKVRKFFTDCLQNLVRYHLLLNLRTKLNSNAGVSFMLRKNIEMKSIPRAPWVQMWVSGNLFSRKWVILKIKVPFEEKFFWKNLLELKLCLRMLYKYSRIGIEYQHLKGVFSSFS